MPKKITNAEWSSSKLLPGLSLNADTGVLTGSLSLSEGVYTVPVKVSTNYGDDQKDLKVVIVDKAAPVYAIGSASEIYSEGAEADVNGFRKLNMPDANKLVPIYYGFAMRTGDFKWYVCGDKKYGQENVDFTTPKEYPFDNIQGIAGGYELYSLSSSSSSSIDIFLLSTSDGEIYFSSDHIGSSYSKLTRDGSVLNIDEIKLHNGLGCAGAVKHGTYTFRLYGSKNRHDYSMSVFADKEVKTVVLSDYLYVLTSNGELYECSGDVANKVELEESVKSIFAVYNHNESRRGLFVVTKSNKLYARGKNNGTSHHLGLPNNSYTEFTEVGIFNVKRIESARQSSFMLTEDGKLYHAGISVDGITEAHSEFTQIFAEYKFKDIAFILFDNNKTLMVIKE